MDATQILSPDLAAKFAVQNTTCPILLNTAIGDVDMRTMTEEQAGKLADGGCDYLVRIDTKKKTGTAAQPGEGAADAKP